MTLKETPSALFRLVSILANFVMLYLNSSFVGSLPNNYFVLKFHFNKQSILKCSKKMIHFPSPKQFFEKNIFWENFSMCKFLFSFAKPALQLGCAKLYHTFHLTCF